MMDKLWRSMVPYSCLGKLNCMHDNFLQKRGWWSLALLDEEEEAISFRGSNEEEEFSVSLGSLKQPPNPKCQIVLWATAKGLICTVGFLGQRLHEILVFNVLNGSSKRLPLPLDSEVSAMVMFRDPWDAAAYKVVIFHSFYISIYSSKKGDWRTQLTENTYRPSSGVVATGRYVYYAFASELHVLDLEDWKLVRKAFPPSECIEVDEHKVQIFNNLFSFRGRCLTISGLHMEGDKEDCLALWELDQEDVQDKRIKNPWVLWRCMPYHLLKEFFEKAQQIAYIKQYQFEAFFDGHLVGVALKGHSKLGGLAYDLRLDTWSQVPDHACMLSKVPIPPILCFQPDGNLTLLKRRTAQTEALACLEFHREWSLSK